MRIKVLFNSFSSSLHSIIESRKYNIPFLDIICIFPFSALIMFLEVLNPKPLGISSFLVVVPSMANFIASLSLENLIPFFSKTKGMVKPSSKINISTMLSFRSFLKNISQSLCVHCALKSAVCVDFGMLKVFRTLKCAVCQTL